MDARSLTFSFGEQDFAVPIRHRNLCGLENDDEDSVKAVVARILRSSRYNVIFHNALFDLRFFENNGYIDLDDIRATVHDTMILSQALNPILQKEGESHGLKALFNHLLRRPGEPFQRSYEETCNGMDFRDLQLAEAAEYAAHDTRSTLRLYHFLYKEASQHPNLLNYYLNVDMPNVFNTIEMQQTGLPFVDGGQRGT